MIGSWLGTIKHLFHIFVKIYFSAVSYPKFSHFGTVAEVIFDKWPHLLNIHNSYQNAFDLWKTRLQTHFKNTHSRINIPSILARKRKHINNGNNDLGEKPTATKQKAWGMQNYLPEYPEEDDEKTILHLLRS